MSSKSKSEPTPTGAENKDEPLVEVGEKIKLEWSEEGGKGRTIHAKVISVSRSSKRKHGSYYKYELALYKENNEIISTRLINLPWERKSKSSSKRTRDDNSSEPVAVVSNSDAPTEKKHKVDTTSTVFTSASVPSKNSKSTSRTGITPECLHHIVAPMVGGSELAFRLLCRKYGATLAYTPMMSSEKFAVDAEYRKTEFQTTPEDRPLVAHFSANDPKLFLQAALHVQDQCDAIGECSLFVCLLLFGIVLPVRCLLGVFFHIDAMDINHLLISTQLHHT